MIHMKTQVLFSGFRWQKMPQNATCGLGKTVGELASKETIHIGFKIGAK